MKLTVRLLAAAAASAILLGAGLASPVARAADEKADKDKANEKKVSKAASKPLKAAKDAADAKKYPEALEKLKEAEALPEKSAYDIHVINELYGFVYVRTQQYPEAAKALEAGLSDGFLEESEAQSRLKALAQVNYQIKNYDKAIEFGNKVIKSGQGDDDMVTLVSQAYYIKGDYPGTLKFTNDYSDEQIKAGKQPKEQLLNLALSSCSKMDDNDCTAKALERMVSFYPKPAYWQNLLQTMFQQKGMTDKNLLQIYRLATQVDGLRGADDYMEYAQLSLEAGSPGEAQAVLEKGTAANIFTDPKIADRAKRLLENAMKQAEQDRASLDKIAKDAAAGKTGDKDVSIGLAYIGYKQYDKAVEAITRGLSKPGVQNQGEANLLLGIAQLGAGHKDEAQKAFGSVKGDAKLERLANLWSLHARQA